jgi:hypothetical protein
MPNYGTQIYPLEKHWAGNAQYLKEMQEEFSVRSLTRLTSNQTLFVARRSSAGETENTIS